MIICFMYAYVQRVSPNLSYFEWLFALSFELKMSTELVVTQRFLSLAHMSNVTFDVTYLTDTFSIRNILLRWLFT